MLARWCVGSIVFDGGLCCLSAVFLLDLTVYLTLLLMLPACDMHCTGGCATQGAGLCDSACASGYSLVTNNTYAGGDDYTCASTSRCNFTSLDFEVKKRALKIKKNKELREHF